jgi:hypothetical protein
VGRLTEGMSERSNPWMGPSCCLKPRLRSPNPLVGPGCGGVVEVVGDAETKLGFGGDAEANRCLGEIEGVLASGGCVLKSVLELQASAGHDDARTCDLWPVGCDGALCVGAAGLRSCVEGEDRQQDERDRRRVRPRHAKDDNRGVPGILRRVVVRLRRRFQNLDAGYCSRRLGTASVIRREVVDRIAKSCSSAHIHATRMIRI